MKYKLLVVDDDRSVLESLTKLLEAEQYEVYPARDAAEAMECFNSESIDLVVLDINLGADDGWEVFEEMTAKNPFVPTIVITAEWGQREQAVARGAEGLIEKPIDVPAFLKMTRELLNETTESKLKRICGSEAYCRYVGRHYEPYLRMLQERYAAPLKITSNIKRTIDKGLDGEPHFPEVIPTPAIMRGSRTAPAGTRTASLSSEQRGVHSDPGRSTTPWMFNSKGYV